MTKRGTYVGVDIMKPVAPTSEKQAELQAEAEADAFAGFDLNTLEGARNAVRPAAVLLGLQALFSLVFAALYAGQDVTLALTHTLGLVLLGSLAGFVFVGSRIATILAALWVALEWLTKVINILNGELGYILSGTIYLVFVTGAVAWAVPASFAYVRHARKAKTEPAEPNTPDSPTP